MIGIIQRFGMAIELSHRKITVFLLYHHNSFGKSVLTSTSIRIMRRKQEKGAHLGEAPYEIKKQAAEIQSLILSIVEHSGLEPLTSTLPVLRSTR